MAEADRLLQHVRDQHIREPGVAQALFQILSEAGIIGPDGRPTAAAQREAPGIEEEIEEEEGDGGQDPGAMGRGGTREKDVTLAIARRLAAAIDAEDGTLSASIVA